MRPLLTQFEGAPVGLGLKQLSVGATLAGSFVNCSTMAPNGSFVNHQQLFGSVCKTAGLRIRPIFLNSFGPFLVSWPEIYPAENTSVSLKGEESCGGKSEMSV